MLTIVVPGVESFDNEKQVFVKTSEDVTLHLEHSLVSLSKWESRFEKPFLSDDPKTTEEVYGYLQAMNLEAEVPEEVFTRFTDENFKQLNEYIESKMTATWFRTTDQPRGYNSEAITSEIMYHWIVALNIDWQAQYWHLNRLVTLVKTINEKNKAASDSKKNRPPTSAELADRRALMEKRRAESAARGGG